MARTRIVRQALFQTDQVDEREPVARAVFQRLRTSPREASLAFVSRLGHN